MCKYVSRQGSECKRYGNHDGYCLRHSQPNKEPIEKKRKKKTKPKTKIIQEDIPENIPEVKPEEVSTNVKVLPSKPKLQKTNKLPPVEQIQPVGSYSNHRQLSKYDVKHYVKKYVKKINK